MPPQSSQTDPEVLPPFPPRIGPVAQDLLQRLLCKDPRKPLGAGPQGAQGVKDHPFFQVRLLAHPHSSLHTPGLGYCSGLGDTGGMV